MGACGGLGRPAGGQQAAAAAAGVISSGSSGSDTTGGRTDSSEAAVSAAVTAHISMKSLVLAVPPMAAAITQRLVARCVCVCACVCVGAAAFAASVGAAAGVLAPLAHVGLAVVRWRLTEHCATCLCVPAAPGVHTGTRSTSCSAACGQHAPRGPCRQRPPRGGSMPAPRCWRSAGSGARPAACGRH
jgi:hypothetical protein